MRRKIILQMLVIALLVLLVGVGVAQAQASQNYNMTLNSWAGGNYGGGTMSSASYTLVMSTGTQIKVQSTSAGYELCSGFICQADKGFFQMRLPALEKSLE